MVALTSWKTSPVSWPRIWWMLSRNDVWKWHKLSASFFTSTTVPLIRPSSTVDAARVSRWSKACSMAKRGVTEGRGATSREETEADGTREREAK